MRLPSMMAKSVSRLFCRSTPAFSTQSLPLFGLEKLENRAVLRVSGAETSSFLQGLITNDMRHLEEGAISMFCMFLNTKGRVLFDSIIYKDSSATDSFLVECDKAAEQSLRKHLTMYKVRRKISIEDAGVSVFAAFGEEVEEEVEDLALEYENLVVCRDPRLKTLGFRLIAPEGELSQNCSSGCYRDLRLGLGVGEGTEELPLGNCFPLEANCDYLHGVSFHKGCYIGQELTARTHHTGVVRKRLMPIWVDDPEKKLELESPVLSPDGKNLGKLRGISDAGVGIALLRVAEALKCPDDLKIGDIDVVTMRPDWWPPEASKDKPS